MKRRKLWKKLFAINLIAFLLFWTAGPSIVLASFISPGKPITPGTAITPGSPITGGQFIAPGEVLTPGESYVPGQPGSGDIPSVSGKPIIPTQPFTNGLFITPNYISAPYSGWLQTGAPITTGEAGNTGNGLNSGQPGTGGGAGPNGGQPGTGGTGPNGGQVGTGGTGPNGGQPGTGGTGPNGGQVGTGGTGPNGGQPGAGGTGPNGGQPGTGGTGPNGGQVGTGGSGPEGGNAGSGKSGTSGGQTGTGGTTESEGPSNLNVLIKSTDDSRGSIVQSINVLRDIKTYWFGFGDKIVGPFVALYAGFDIKKIESGRLQGNYAIKGKDSVKNPILNKYYQKFKEYKINGETKKLGNGARHVKPDKIDGFNAARKIAKPGMTNKTSWQLAKEAAKSSVDDAVNVLKLKNIAKLNGVANIALSSVNSLYDYNWGNKKSLGMGSTDFAADLTTDVAVGVGITALSTVAGSMAAGAVVGTAIPIPIVGTLVGAGVGLLVGGISTLVLNTKIGRSVKTFVRDTVKAGYDGALEVGKGISRGAIKATKGIVEAGSKLFKSVGSMFG